MNLFPSIPSSSCQLPPPRTSLKELFDWSMKSNRLHANVPHANCFALDHPWSGAEQLGARHPLDAPWHHVLGHHCCCVARTHQISRPHEGFGHRREHHGRHTRKRQEHGKRRSLKTTMDKRNYAMGLKWSFDVYSSFLSI